MAAFLDPVVRSLLSSRQAAAAPQKVTAAEVGGLAPDTPRTFKFGSSLAALNNTAEGELVALSAICIHLIRAVRFESGSAPLFCPCRNRRFDPGATSSPSTAGRRTS